MVDVWTPPKPASDNGTTFKSSARLISSTFGDGYKQSVPDGLNVHPRSGTLVLENLNADEASEAANFIDAHTGYTFVFTVPGEPFGRLWIAPNGYSQTWKGALTTFSIDLEERFDLS